jgi:hypothetical protein
MPFSFPLPDFQKTLPHRKGVINLAKSHYSVKKRQKESARKLKQEQKRQRKQEKGKENPENVLDEN